LAAGFGFGLNSALIQYINPLAFSLGESMLQCKACPSLDLFFITGILALLFQILHISWNIIAYYALKYTLKIRVAGIFYVVITHVCASFSVF
jgi:hypothetical protein